MKTTTHSWRRYAALVLFFSMQLIYAMGCGSTSAEPSSHVSEAVTSDGLDGGADGDDAEIDVATSSAQPDLPPMSDLPIAPNACMCSICALSGNECCIGGAVCCCATGQYCFAAGDCRATQTNGSSCSRGGMCQSGNCVDGVCCDSPCNGLCQACSLAKKGHGYDGVCESIGSGADPDNECADQGAASCGTNGVCNGAGACALYANGTVCAGPTCSGTPAATVTSKCNGAGSCLVATTTQCGNYACASASACSINCFSDANCAPSAWCRSDATCLADQAVGATCTSGSQCTSGNCVDGYCCDTACSGPCQACSTAKKGQGANGSCGSIKAGTDPDSECAADAVSTCQHDGWCNGAGACELYANGTACGSSTCAAGVQTGYACNGAGTCQTGTMTSCAPYVCANGSTCGNSCSSEADCVAADYCRISDHTCQPDQAIGAPCSAGSQCANGNCVDGYCCDTACAGLCQACSAAKKGSGLDGVCGNVAASSDPDAECTDQGAASCKTNGSCDGSGACSLYANGTVCGATVCSNGQQNGYSCNGSGSCLAANTTTCFPYFCGGSSCATACNSDSDCVASYWCRISDHTCQADQANAKSCTLGSQCVSGNCIDGVCCDTACTGTCQACSATKKGAGPDGVCGNVGAGTDPDSECADQGSGTCGTNGACSGVGSCALYPQGTACGTTTCSGGVQVGQACNGAGTCVNAASSQCTPYVCVGPACAASCTDDTQCVASSYCRTSNGTCQPDQANGSACTAGSQCTSGNCVDGFCCDTACAGTCQACSNAKKGSGADGACGNIAADTDPDAECPDQGQPSCGTNGSCNGSGACGLYAQGAACGATTCTNGVQNGQSCNGTGTCVTSSTTPCAPYACVGSACAIRCGDDSQCIAGAYCRASDSTCQLDKAIGSGCTASSQCTSGNCVDGTCCDTGCTGICQACTAAKKGSGMDGTCGPIAAGTDPDAECSDDTPSSCKHDGSCNGSGECRLYAKGTTCGPTTCQGNLVKGQICDGLGNCSVDTNGVDCAPYLCQGTGCANPCASDSQCITGDFCDQGTCKSKGTPGQPCGAAGECASGFCVDGYCCDQACSGQCQACDLMDSHGKCSPVQGAQHGNRPACAAASPECSGACDGVNTSACTYPGSTKSCGTTSCQDGVQSNNSCDGAGTCQQGTTTTKCGAYACDGTSKCRNACTDDTDCSTGFGCTPTKLCAPKAGPKCDGDHKVVAPDGTATDCTPFRCEVSQCKTTCRSIDDCVAPALCDTDVGCTLPAAVTPPPAESGGCGCRVTGAEGRAPGNWSIVASVLLLAITSRRRTAARRSR